MSGAWLWLLVPTAPLLAALMLFVARERAIPWLSLGCLPALAAVLWPMPVLELPWVWEGVRWGGDDPLTRAWLAFSGVLWGAAGLFALDSLRGTPGRLRFWTFWQVALCGNLLLIVAADALSFYLGFSLMSLAAYGLIVHQRGPEPRRAGRLYLQLAILGEMALLAGLMLRTAALGGSFAFELWQAASVDGLTLLLLLLGLGLKAGFWPLHVWLPLAHPAAPAPASAVLSGAMIKAGLLGLWRCLPQSDPLLAAWAPWVLGVGLFGALYAVVLGLCATRAKTVLAYSSVSQMGWALLLLALLWRHPEQPGWLAGLLVLFVVHHGLAKGSLFLAAGMVHEARLPAFAWFVLILPALALAGLPFSTGAAVKLALKDAWKGGDFAVWLPLLSLASLASALLLMRALWLLRRDERHAPDRPPAILQWLPWLVLSVAPLALPWLWSAFAEPLAEHAAASDLWNLAWPLLAAYLLARFVLRKDWCVPLRLARLPQPSLRVSLQLKRLLQQPPLRELSPRPDRVRWRARERRLNRVLSRSGAVAISIYLVALLIWFGWLW